MVFTVLEMFGTNGNINDLSLNIHYGKALQDVTGYLHTYKSIYLIYDEALGDSAETIGKEIWQIKGYYKINVSEKSKSIETVFGICRWLIRMEASKDSLLLGLGGGVICDITGFAGTIYMRGISFAFIPTTVLSQADAALGGKNGVNIDGFKNIAGTISFPEFTFICTEVLRTLPEKELKNGIAEILKSFIINNENDYYHKAIRLFSKFNSEKIPEYEYEDELQSVIAGAGKIKMKIVNEDPFETLKIRKKLNLGHTFAHAIEWKSGEMIPHGMAVSMGIILAARLSEKIFMTEFATEKKLREDFESCGLPCDCPYTPEELREAFLRDKKRRNNIIDFILIKNIGEVEIVPLDVDFAINKLK